MRAAIYTRVAVDSIGKEIDLPPSREHQEEVLKQSIRERGWYLAGVYHDQTGLRRLPSELGSGFHRLLVDTQADCHDVVLVTSFDRLAPTTRLLVAALAKIDQLGVRFISGKEAIDTGTVQGHYAVKIIAAIQAVEDTFRLEQMRVGVIRRPPGGLNPMGGRPKAEVDMRVITALRHEGLSWKRIAKLCGTSTSTARRAYLEAMASPVLEEPDEEEPDEQEPDEQEPDEREIDEEDLHESNPDTQELGQQPSPVRPPNTGTD